MVMWGVQRVANEPPRTAGYYNIHVSLRKQADKRGTNNMW